MNISNYADIKHRFFSDGLLDLRQHLTNIPVDADALLSDLIRRIGFTEIQAGIYCFGILCCHLPEGIFDYNGCIIAHAKL